MFPFLTPTRAVNRGELNQMPDENEQVKTEPQNSETENASGSEATTPTTEKSGEKLFTQEDVNRLIDDRLQRERKKAESEAKKAREQAEAKALEEQKEFQKLAEQRGEKLAAIEPQAKRYEEALTKLLTAEKAGVPEHVLALLEKLDPAEQLEWIADNRDKLKPAESTPESEPDKQRGIPRTPPRGDQRGATEEQKRQRQERVARSYRGRF